MLINIVAAAIASALALDDLGAAELLLLLLVLRLLERL